MSLTDFDINQAVIDFLKKNPNKPFKTREIASQIAEDYPDQAKEKAAKSKQENYNFISQVAAELSGGRRQSLCNRDSHIRCYEHPIRFYYSLKDGGEDQISPSAQANAEHKLYPVIVNALRDTFQICAMRIDEKTSTKSSAAKANQWLHPDIVGAQDLGENWKVDVKDCAVQSHASLLRLWSFEVKTELNMSNVRSSFFQAVSNSSWANYGYLVARTISSGKNDSVMDELQMLCAVHGIGFMKLSSDDDEPNSSKLDDLSLEIVIPARLRDADWVTMNRIALANKDFATYINRVTEFHKLGYLKPSSWGYDEE